MSEMVEWVAKAMAEAEGDATVMDHWRRRASAAIAAMREPTEAMLTNILLLGEGNPEWWGDQSPKDIWQAMIDEALK